MSNDVFDDSMIYELVDKSTDGTALISDGQMVRIYMEMRGCVRKWGFQLSLRRNVFYIYLYLDGSNVEF